jgi:hypothetical protein
MNPLRCRGANGPAYDRSVLGHYPALDQPIIHRSVEKPVEKIAETGHSTLDLE